MLNQPALLQDERKICFPVRCWGGVTLRRATLGLAVAVLGGWCGCAATNTTTRAGGASSAWPNATPAGAASALAATRPATAPLVLYTDIVSGPTSGGENNKGAYLSVFGRNFGSQGLGSNVRVYINEVEVDNYRYLGPSRGLRDIQQITVQVGELGHAKPGLALPLKVVVGGVASNSDHTFTVQPGDILFLSQTGDDGSAKKNDINHPWRHLQTADEGGALGASQPGDMIVLRGGPGVIWSDTGYGNRWCRFRRVTGNAPTGVKGHGYISIVSYPGEDVHYVPPPNTNGGIHGIGENYEEFSDWIVIAGLHIESVATSRTDGAPINLHAHSDHWRVVNNELGPWPAPSTADDRAAGVAGNGKDVAVLGNHIHDIGGGQLNHGIYIDSGATDVDIAYNSIHDIVSGNLIQTHDKLGNVLINGVKVHHNVLFNGGRYGLNIADGSHSYAAWNNLIYNTALAAVRFNVWADPSASYIIVHNTIWNTNTVSSNSNGPIANDWHLNQGTAVFKHNIVATGPQTQGTLYFVDISEGQALKFERNLWYGRGLGTALRIDADPVGHGDMNDPRLVDLGKQDCTLAADSPALDQATAAMPFPIADDFDSRPRPQGAHSDVGACERTVPAGSQPPSDHTPRAPVTSAPIRSTSKALALQLCRSSTSRRAARPSR